MTGLAGNHRTEVANVVHLEDQLAERLNQAARQVDHMDCFDLEQRSEIYTILKALRDDTDAHRRTIGRWVSDREGGDA